MSVERIVQAWLRASEGDLPNAPDAFFKFIAAWVAFNATYAYRYGVNIGDKAGVIRFATEANNQDRHQKCLKTGEYQAAVHALSDRGVVDLRSNQLLQITNPEDLVQV